jgi:hypothetical protein
MSKSTWPAQLGPKRAFQRRKRREYNEALAALNRLRVGCYYFPSYAVGRGVPEVIELLEAVGVVCRPWWRKA